MILGNTSGDNMACSWEASEPVVLSGEHVLEPTTEATAEGEGGHGGHVQTPLEGDSLKTLNAGTTNYMYTISHARSWLFFWYTQLKGDIYRDT